MNPAASHKTPTLMGRKGHCFRLKKEEEKRRRETGEVRYLYSLGDCQENLSRGVFDGKLSHGNQGMLVRAKAS